MIIILAMMIIVMDSTAVSERTLFSDDDDLWHPARLAEYARAAAGAGDAVRALAATGPDSNYTGIVNTY